MNAYNKTQRGNVLFLILLAVMLFAALNFAINDMVSGENAEKVGKYKARTLAESVIDYTRILRTAIKSAGVNGCKDLEVSFENNIVEGYEHTPEAREECKIFSSTAGAVNYILPLNDVLDITHKNEDMYNQWFFPGKVCVEGVGSADENCDADDVDNESLVVVLPYVTYLVCQYANNHLNGSMDIQTISEAMWSDDVKFVGAKGDGEKISFDGASGGCFQHDDAYYFFQVLLAR